jgi:endonuclease/exonuclease/phosphatase (EEP) superfamily protein YafD
MCDKNSPTLAQFNMYKYVELSSKLKPFLQDRPPHFIEKTKALLRDYCASRNLQELASRWQEADEVPSPLSASLSLLYYNIRNFYSNQAELIDMISSLSPSIISLNELGTVVPLKTIKQLRFSYQLYASEGTNTHGGAVLAIDKGLKPLQIVTRGLNFVAAEITIGSRPFVVAGIYSPPTERLPLAEMTTLLKLLKNVIIAGDFNAKHPEWGCPQVNMKERQLEEWLHHHNFKVLNTGVRTSLRSNTTIDLIISSNEPEATTSKIISYLNSDHLPVFTHFHHLQA